MTARVPGPPLWIRLAPALFVALWSGGYAFAKIGLAHAEPMTFLSLRFGFALLILAGVFLIMRPPLPESAAQWRHLLVSGLLIQVCYFGFSYMAFWLGAAAGAVALIVSMQPILVALAAPLVVGERVSAVRWAGLGLGLAGAALVIVSRLGMPTGELIGLAVAGLALFAMSAAALHEKRSGTAVNPIVAIIVQYGVGLACILPIAYGFETMRVAWTAEFAGALAYLVIGNSVIAVTLLLAMLRAGEATRVSALLFLVPPGAALLAWGLIGETLSPLAWAGMALAAAGVGLATRPAQPKRP